MKKNLFILIASLFLCGTIFAQEPEHYWTVNYGQYEDNTTIVAWVKLDDVFIENEDVEQYIEIAAFVGEEVRMSDFLINMNWHEVQHAYLNSGIQCNPSENGTTVTYKMYNHYTNKEYDLCDFTSVIGTDNMNPNDPVVLPFHSSFTKEISSYTSSANPNGGYYFIASPIEGEVDPAVTEGTPRVTNLLTNSFDLYYFDQNGDEGLEWRNYESTPFHLTSGKGYLYANNQDVTLTFIGAPYSGDGKVILEKLSGPNVEFPGWNLVGNPWAQTAYITKGFYTLDEDGYDVVAGTGNSVNAMEGIFVIAETDGEEMIFSTEPAASGTKLVMDLSQERGNTIDRAIVSFGNGGTLPKFQLHPNNTKLYIPQNNEDYAVVNSGNDANLPVCFKAAQRGIYTLTLTADQVDMNYLHLIDNKTGIDQDMLSNPRYTFEADVNDNPNRFVLQFHATITGVEESFNPITFRHDGNLTINGVEGGELTIIDLLGRVVSNETFHGDIVRNISNTPGVYVVRLITEGKTYTQKIVVE